MTVIEDFRVTELIAPGQYGTGLFVVPGVDSPNTDRFCSWLSRNKTVLMSDDIDTLEYFQPLIDNAFGDVLLLGLGLGCAIKGLLTKPEVDSITVLELHGDIVTMVEPFFPEATIIVGNALTYTWPGGTHFNTVWCDCWEDPADTRYADVVAAYTPISDWIGTYDA